MPVTAPAKPAELLAAEHARSVVRQAVACGYAATGAYYQVPGFTSRKAASDGRLALLAAAARLGYRCTCTDLWDVLSQGDGTFLLRFRLGPA